MNYISQLNAFWERATVDSKLTAVHKSLYFALLQINNLSNWRDSFTAVYREVMHYASIKSMTTYYTVLNDLKEWGYIEYEKGRNQYEAASFSLPVLYQNLDNQLTKHMAKHMGTMCESTDISTDQSSSQSTGDILKQENLETNKPINLETKGAVAPEVGPVEFSEPIKKEKRKKASWQKKKETELIYPFPDSVEFMDAWDKWLDYRRERTLTCKPMYQQAALQDLDQLSSHEHNTALAIIHQSISKGWQGLFELKTPIIPIKNGQRQYSAERVMAAVNRRYGVPTDAGTSN